MKAKAMTFHSPTEQPVHLALTSGHTALVEHDGTLLDPIFHREAIANGCVPKGIPGREHEGKPTLDRRALIKASLKEMISGEEPDDFLPNGMPAKGKLDAKLGFKSERHEVESIFAELTAEAEAESEGKSAEAAQEEGEGETDEKEPAPAPTKPKATTKAKAKAKAAKK